MSILVSIITLALNGPFVDQGFQEKVIRVLVWNFAIVIQMMHSMVSSEATSDLGWWRWWTWGASPWRLNWVWSVWFRNVLIKLNLETISNFDFLKEHVVSLWSLLNNKVAFIDIIEMVENSWNVLCKIIIKSATTESKVSVYNLPSCLGEFFLREVESASWCSIFAASLKSISLDKRSHQKIILG